MKSIFWQTKHSSGYEALYFHEEKDGFSADSVVLGSHEGQIFRLHYRIYIDSTWRVSSLHIRDVLHSSGYKISADGKQKWSRSDVMFDDDERDFAGCTDIDISCTPFTNTLPIRRLNLEVGQSAEIKVLYVDCPQIRFDVSRQKYERLSELQYRFTSLETDFTAIITVDEDGFVTDYPELFERKYP